MKIQIALIFFFPLLIQSLFDDQNPTLIELVSLKNVKNRYNLKLDSISNRFTPEDPSYYQGLFTEGWWAVGLSIVTVLVLLGCLYCRFRYGYFGGKRLKNTEFTTFTRWAPGLILSVSFILFFISGVSLLIESSKISKKSENLTKITSNYSKTLLNDVQNTYDYLISLNMQHFDQSLYVSVANLNEVLEDSKIDMKKSMYFKNDVKLLDNRRVIITIVAFGLGVIFFALGLLGFILKIESLGYTLAISMGVVASLEFLVVIPYVMERVASTDFCEQIIECTAENSLPVEGHELGYYFADFSKATKDQLEIVLADLNNQLIIANSKAKGIGNIDTNDLSETGLSKIIWKESTLILQKSIDEVNKLKNSFYIKKLCRDVNQNVCGDVFQSFILAEFTVIIVAISFLIASFSGFLAPRLFQRWKLEEEQNSLAKHNYYNIKNRFK